MNKTYYVKYRLYSWSDAKGFDVLARSKSDAYDKAVYEKIPEAECGQHPYSAWVHSVTYNNGNYLVFNTSEVNPY